MEAAKAKAEAGGRLTNKEKKLLRCDALECYCRENMVL